MTAMWAFLFACGESEPVVEEVAPAPDPAVGLGWVGALAFHPEQFTAAVEGHREGWVALHANDPGAAWAAFSAAPVDAAGAARAALALGVFHEDLAALSGLVHETLWTRWSQAKDAAPMPEDATMVAAFGASCNGRESATAWAARVKTGADQPLAVVISTARSPFQVSEGTGVVGKRAAVHRKAMAATDPAGLVEVAGTPIWTDGAPKAERHLWDPCVDATLARIWYARASGTQGTADPARSWKSPQGLGGDALPVSLFAAWLDGPELQRELHLAKRMGEVGARSGTALGVSPVVGPTDAPDAARTMASALDAALAAWSAKILDQAPPEGEALARELAVVARLRQQWLLARTRVELGADHPKLAGVLVQLAEDRDRAGIGPGNDPSLWVLRAHAELANGHFREALDALHAVVEAFPHAKGIEETLSDLVVLDGLGKPGDSKEDP